MNEIYRRKVDLLLRILPSVSEESCFAVHGGTAINMFLMDLPRYSVDIDLTYIPLENRTASIQHINEALKRIAERIKTRVKGAHIIERLDIGKLTCEFQGVQIKIEVNLTKRGVVGGDVMHLPLCEKAQKEFNSYVKAPIVPTTLLYGGKIAAALSRQHPRDMFDIAHMRISLAEAKFGFMFCLLGSERPLYESFAPSLIDQRDALVNQFDGMSDEPFSYDDFERTRSDLIENVRRLMNEEDKQFLISFEKAKPEWEDSPYESFRDYPSVQWKLMNLQRLKESNQSKQIAQAGKLAEILSRS